MSEEATGNGGQKESRASEIVNPESVLPLHLQGRSFAHDVWSRVKSHPLKNQSLNNSELVDNAETREIVRQVLAAADEREKEVLLHNQARLFREVLNQILSQAWHFIDNPIGTKRKLVNSVKIEEVNEKNEAKSGGGFLKGLGLALITPKYIFLSIAIIFGLISGYQRIKVSNLESAIASYKEADVALQNTHERTQLLMGSLESEKTELNSEITDLTGRLSVAESKRNEFELLNAKLTSEVDSLKSQAENLTDATLAAIDSQKEVTELEKKLSQSETATATAQNSVERMEDILEARNKELSTFRQANDKLRLRNQELESKANLLRFAETFISHMRRQVGGWSSPDKKQIKQYLREYDSAYENLGN